LSDSVCWVKVGEESIRRLWVRRVALLRIQIEQTMPWCLAQAIPLLRSKVLRSTPVFKYRRAIFFEAIAYGKATVTTDFEGSDWVAGLEMMGIFYFEDKDDVRVSEFAVVLRYRF